MLETVWEVYQTLCDLSILCILSDILSSKFWIHGRQKVSSFSIYFPCRYTVLQLSFTKGSASPPAHHPAEVVEEESYQDVEEVDLFRNNSWGQEIYLLS